MFGINKEVWSKYTKKEKLYVFCKKIHVLGLAQFINRKVLRNAPTAPEQIKRPVQNKKNNTPKDNWVKLEKAFEKAHMQFYSDIPGNKRKIVFSGHITEFDKGTCSYLNDLQKELDNTEILLISHATNQKYIKTNRLMNCKYFKVPFTFSLNRYQKGINVEIPENVKKIIEEKDYLALTEERIRLRHKDMGEGYPAALTYFLYDYYCKFIEYYQPDAVILWCEFYCGHNMLKNICEEYGIKVLYMEFGALPGTFAIEENGQMGESSVAVDWKKFKELPVNQEEILSAKEVLKYLKETGLNRRVQVKTNVLDEFRKKYIPGRPVVVMFGQNDYEAGIKPYTEQSREYHSPFFKGSDDAALFVEKLAIKNNWNYIYKPHQMMVRVGECLENSFSDKTMWVGDSDINELIDIADVVITIVSQCGYVSLIREKPTVMLGYTQLRGKGCTYEPKDIDDVESVINRALKEGYTQEQKESFEKHTAQLLKYYLFDDRLPKKYAIGQEHTEAVKLINNSVEFPDMQSKHYDERNVLFLCENECEIQSAINLAETLNNSVKTDIAIINSKKIDLSKVKDSYHWNCIYYSKNIEEFMSEFNNDIYTDLYVTGYERMQLLVFNKLRDLNNTLKVHIFDGGDTRLYLCNVGADMEKMHLKSFFSRLSEIYIYDKGFMVLRDKAEIKMYIMPDMQMEYFKNILRHSRKKVYAESWLMSKGFISNETDLIDDVSNKEKMSFLAYSGKSYDMLCNNGFSAVGCDEETSDGNLIFSPVFNMIYFCMAKDGKYKFVDLSNFLTTGNAVFNSNTYRKFLKICDEKVVESKGYYHPKSIEEVKYITECLEKE